MVPGVSVALAATALHKRYGRIEALAGVDIEVGEGQLVGLLGPNGAGKSTLVKIACGLVRPSGGAVEICGAPAGSPAARRALGYLAELFRFPGWMSADELLVLHQRLAGSRGGVGERGELLELVGLEHARDLRVAAMSKGMQQRLGIAQALVGSPRLLLLDEPTSALDPSGRRVVRALLEELRSRGTAVLLNSHLLSEVELVCDHVVIVDHGKVVAAGRPDDLRRQGGVEIDTGAGTQALPRGDARRHSAARPRAGRGRRGRLRGPRRLDDPRRGLSRGGRMTAIVLYGFRESLRRKMFLVVLVLTAVFLGLYGYGVDAAFKDAESFAGPGQQSLDPKALAGATVFGLALFAIMFLGGVLAVFLTLNVVRGDAEAGLLQPLVVRPIGRAQLLVRAVCRSGRSPAPSTCCSSTSPRSASPTGRAPGCPTGSSRPGSRSPARW